mgnify:CR=1 FL=1
MPYKTFVIDYHPIADIMSKKLEEKLNELEKENYEFISFSITNSAKAIIVVKEKEIC